MSKHDGMEGMVISVNNDAAFTQELLIELVKNFNYS